VLEKLADGRKRLSVVRWGEARKWSCVREACWWSWGRLCMCV